MICREHSGIDKEKPLSEKSVIRWYDILVVGGLVSLAAVLILLSPNEKTLGSGIKVVYVHVASIWTGLVGFLILGVLGLLLVATQKKTIRAWVLAWSWMSLFWFALGVSTSVLAAKINWGGIFWAEPRFQMAWKCLIVVLLTHTINLWLDHPRVQGLLAVIPSAYVSFSVWATPLLLHPKQPIRNADAPMIQWTFRLMFFLALALAVWLAFWITRMVLKPSIPNPEEVPA